MRRNGWILFFAVIGVIFVSSCSAQQADAEPALEVAGVDWVEQEVGKVEGEVNSLDERTNQLEKDIQLLQSEIDGSLVFTDVPSSYWAYTEIMYMYENGYIIGYPEERLFKPENQITRAQAAKMLVEALDLPISQNPSPFTDVPEDFWAKKYIVTVAEHGFFIGSNGKFLHNDPMTRRHMALVLQRALDLPPSNEPFEDYIDVPKTDEAYESIKLLSQYKIAQGNLATKEFMPNQATKRSQFATFLYRAIQGGYVN
ncbi:S-layer homology domain-containing protein [Bacillus litorisediminis]|uniref:S-layer homology domain-containing protein n=1 Tax=Bacillus litorisediminis TaxID=2922713 RepID=UPI001FAEF50C|nr:S-layer homology domain-containing protein [Bacillus litorisediminis]